MQQAEGMLMGTSLTVKEVVSAIGLNDRSHFSREFKALHGLTPTEFVRQRRIYGEEPRLTGDSKSGH